MIKMTMLLKRNPELTHEQFVQHHIKKHGPLFRQIPEASAHVLCYIQTHPSAVHSAAVSEDDFDGTAEIWFDDADGLVKVLNSEFYQQQVYPDELTFLDHEHTLTTIGEQSIIIPASDNIISKQS